MSREKKLAIVLHLLKFTPSATVILIEILKNRVQIMRTNYFTIPTPASPKKNRVQQEEMLRNFPFFFLFFFLVFPSERG